MAVIFYLSGSGNSLYAAQQIADDLQECRLETVGSYLRKPYPVTDEVVGIVCPVYCFALPPVVAKFLGALQAKPAYCFGVVTMGGNQGRALKQMSEALAAKRITLNYAQTVMMPDNFFGIPLEKRVKMLEAAEPSINQIAKDIADRKEAVAAVKEALLWKWFGTSASWWYLKNRLKFDNMTVDAAKCVGCGICQDVCQMQNITLVEGKPVFGNNCANCLGCFHWCPQSAISAGKLILDNSKRYVHPKINLQMMKGD
ncbi:MAG: EFR1 family ferrodoxin [Phascolarctobacterium sp.]|nr:EFR1 family ferrodoxin [Phascolarctobacterium sp.]